MTFSVRKKKNPVDIFFYLSILISALNMNY